MCIRDRYDIIGGLIPSFFMRIGIMCSGNGTNFENIVKQCPDHEVVLMIHNTKKCGAIERAERLGVHHCRIKHKDVDNVINLFKVWKVDLIVLAGYMRILSPKMIEAFPNKIINIHPSLLPKYKGCLLYTSPSPRDGLLSRMPSSA